MESGVRNAECSSLTTVYCPLPTPHCSLTTDMDVFVENLAAVRQLNPDLAERLRSDEEDESVVLSATPEGVPTLGVLRDGRTLLLHHPEQPLSDTRRMIASIKDAPSAWNFVVLGIGLGYVPLLLMEKRARLPEILLLVEPSLSVFRAACKTIDLRPVLQQESCRLLVRQPGMMTYQALLSNLPRVLANHVTVIRHPPTAHLYPEWMQEQEARVHDAWRFGNSSLVTKHRLGPQYVLNLLRNLPAFARSRGIRGGQAALRGLPGVIVAGGPSLEKNIDRLSELRNHALLIGVDTVLDRLIDIGAPPHVVVTVDPSELNLRHFRQESYSGVRLAFDAECCPVSERFGSETLTYSTDKSEFFAWLDKVLGPKGTIVKGGMVSQAGFYLARYWGCDPIVLVGQDLALDPDTGETHHSKAALVRKVRWIEGDDQHVEYPAAEPDEDAQRENLFWVPGALGGQVPTVHNLLAYLRLVERDVALTPARVIDATEGGARIGGTDVLSAEEVIQLIHDKTFDFEPFWAQLAKAGSSTEKALMAARREMGGRMDRCVESAARSREILEQLNSRNAPAADFVQRLDPLRRSIFNDSVCDYLIEHVSSAKLFEFLKLGPADADSQRELEETRRRYTALIDATLEAYDKLRNWLACDD